MTALLPGNGAIPPFSIALENIGDIGVLASIGVLAGIYALMALGLQINAGYTGIVNFGQAGFMAVGAYAMAILVVKAGMSFWLALPLAVLITMAFGLVVGLPSLRLRADYFAIATLAAAEVVRYTAQNFQSLTGGNQGIFCSNQGVCYDDSWNDVSGTIEGWLTSLGWSDPEKLFPLLLVVWATVLIGTLGLFFMQRTPWGRVLRAVREDEDAALALGKNALLYKLQSLAIAALTGALAGFFLAINLATIHPKDFEPLVTFIGFGVLILGGLANYWGVAVGALMMLFILEGSRFIDLPLSDERQAALRFVFVGLVLIVLMAFRPQGIFGKKEEMVLGE